VVFSINARPNRVTVWTLSWTLFVAGVGAYVWMAQKRHLENPEDEVVPTFA